MKSKLSTAVNLGSTWRRKGGQHSNTVNLGYTWGEKPVKTLYRCGTKGGQISLKFLNRSRISKILLQTGGEEIVTNSLLLRIRVPPGEGEAAVKILYSCASWFHLGEERRTKLYHFESGLPWGRKRGQHFVPLCTLIPPGRGNAVKTLSRRKSGLYPGVERQSKFSTAVHPVSTCGRKGGR